MALVVALAVFASSPASAKDDTVPAGFAVELNIPGGHCSGFYVGNGTIVTAGHCVDSFADKIEVVADTGADMGQATPILVDKRADVSILKIRKDVALAPVAIDCGPTYVGQRIEIIGWPTRLGMVTTFGYVASLPQSNEVWPSVVILDALADHGNSGGPVVDVDTGKVVGILVGGYAPNQALYTFAVPMARVCSLLNY